MAVRIPSGIITPRASFATTSSLLVAPAKKSGKPSVPSWKNKKEGGVKTKKPNPGERKAFRKRIQLSNNSALAVPGLGKLEAGTLADASSSGKIFAISDPVVDQLRALEAFKPTQSWNLFRSPHVLVRDEVVGVVSKLEAAAKNKETLKAVLTGSKLSGKSLALLQAMAYALMNNWVVINIPEGKFGLFESFIFQL
jgi:small subunit ribosomal protein S29